MSVSDCSIIDGLKLLPILCCIESFPSLKIFLDTALCVHATNSRWEVSVLGAGVSVLALIVLTTANSKFSVVLSSFGTRTLVRASMQAKTALSVASRTDSNCSSSAFVSLPFG
jgi:hypothetical protein